MGKGIGIKQVAYLDCPGGGQVVVKNNIAYIGNMSNPDGTTIVDVSDPRNPRIISRLGMVPGTHSHKVRVANDIMVCNREFMAKQMAPEGFKGGLGIYDVSKPATPKLICDWETAGKGVHRFDFDGEFAYISATEEGYEGHIVKILDLRNPAKPEEVARWWKPGQWTAGGEEKTWEGAAHRCHHPLRVGNRLYTSYWFGGVVILDIEDMSRPKVVSSLNWTPAFPWPTHTALRVPFKVRNRDLMIVADEDVFRDENQPPSFLWMVDINDEKQPVPFGSFQVEAEDGSNRPLYTGCHQPCEIITGTELPVAWFAHGLRIIDFSNPHAVKEIASYVPTPTGHLPRAQSNDVTVDDRGFMYLLDRVRGLNILERT
jgi:hypothetical protein